MVEFGNVRYKCKTQPDSRFGLDIFGTYIRFENVYVLFGGYFCTVVPDDNADLILAQGEVNADWFVGR